MPLLDPSSWSVESSPEAALVTAGLAAGALVVAGLGVALLAHALACRLGLDRLRRHTTRLTPARLRRVVESVVEGVAGGTAVVALATSPLPSPLPVQAADARAPLTAGAPAETPVVRDAPDGAVPTTSLPLAPAPVPTPVPPAPPAPLPSPEPGPAPVATRDHVVHVVAPGESLWSIAADVQARQRSRPADALASAEVAPYWRRLVEANRPTLRSGDPSLVHPGEVVTLPA